MPVDHWMTFSTFAEQDHFEYPQVGAYRGVIINGNMAAYAPDGLAAFLLEKTAPETEYLIDPITHAFQHDPGLISDQQGKPKRSIQSLADAYGSPIKDIVGTSPLLPKDLKNDDVLQAFVERCLSYQSNQISTRMVDSDTAKYMDDSKELHPYALVAPYFYLTEVSIDEWLPVNIRAAKIAADIANNEGKKCFGAVVVGQGILLDPQLIQQICEKMAQVSLDGFLIWADNLDEQSAAAVELRGLLTLTRGLRGENKKPVINLHGDFFSILAAGNLGDGAMTGVAHGPEFGEFRPVVPVGGGIPIAKYYVPGLHARIRYRDAALMLDQLGALKSAEAFHQKICDCLQCKETIAGDITNFTKFGDGVTKSIRRKHGIVRIQFPTTEAKLKCLRHYLQRKHREYLEASRLNADELIKNLRNGEAKYLPVAGSTGVSHLRIWQKVFER